MQKILFLLFLSVFVTSKTALAEVVMDEDRKESLFILLKENPNEIETYLDEEQKEVIIQALQQKLQTCLIEAEPFRENIPPSLRQVLCSKVLKEAGTVISYLEILYLIQSFMTPEQIAKEKAEEKSAQEEKKAETENNDSEDDDSFWSWLPSISSPRY